MKSISKIILFVFLLTALAVKAQFSNYSKYYNWDVFANNNGGGGGGVTLSITNNVLNLSFSGGFSETFLKQGKIAATGYPGTLPNTEVPIPAGSFFTDKGYRFFIIDNQIAIYHDSSMLLTAFSGALSVNLTAPVAPSSDVYSYLSNWTPQNKVTFTQYLSDQGSSGNKKTSIMYYDGLGRELQNIAKGATPSGKDVIFSFEYDSYGRKVKDYLPIPTVQNSGLLIDPGTISGLASSFYNGEPAFSEKVFEASPLDRITMQAAPGNDWKKNSGHEMKFEYGINTTTDNVKKYDLTLLFDTDIYNPSLSINSVYTTGSLAKELLRMKIGLRPAEMITQQRNL
ncbi:DUF6443 domain-containing protein [Chryseobacterium sp. CCH4-E10]|uniref:DUF6443 domain-containing protein n=1 Tax=Chryseobacterium sp. CCH4-E10 TaxID=1768758 RepID=UPI000AF82390|nr:DUF6443 domain-containing protein [Chryseobacterium sp. CCH4-E10]